jgi:adenylate cyclase
VRIFALIGDPQTARSAGFAALAAAHQQMLDAYRARDWDAAERLIKEAREFNEARSLGKLYDLYAERVASFRAAPPMDGWDGVFVATSK